VLLKQLFLGVHMHTFKQNSLGRYPFFSEDHWGFHAIDACLGPGDVARLVRCCPAVELLSIPGLVQPGVDMSPLLGLGRLQDLYVGGVAIDDEVAGSVFARMGGLRRLEVAAAPQLTDDGVLALAGNKGLRELLLVRCGLGGSMPIKPCGGTALPGARCFLVRQKVRIVWFVSELGFTYTACHTLRCLCVLSTVLTCRVLNAAA
jgi:hypothetical protein